MQVGLSWPWLLHGDPGLVLSGPHRPWVSPEVMSVHVSAIVLVRAATLHFRSRLILIRPHCQDDSRLCPQIRGL